MKKIAVICLVLGIFAACKVSERVGVTEEGGVVDASPVASTSASGMLTDPAEPLPAIYMSVPSTSASASVSPANSQSK